MGMFDYVIVRCPKCANKIEFQSKGGECRLTTYTLANAPLNVVVDLEDRSERCDECGEDVSVTTNARAVAVFTEDLKPKEIDD